jgi:hypothetical protein
VRGGVGRQHQPVDAFGNGENVCSVNAQGPGNGYMVSTFSVPSSVVAPDGNQALYSCPANTSTGAYAQCDGGLCFTSTEGASFPGFSAPLTDAQIICSCPITVADSATARVGYQIAGPYPARNLSLKTAKVPLPTIKQERRSMSVRRPGRRDSWPAS